MTYLNEVTAAVKEYITNEGIDLTQYDDRDDAENSLYDLLWVEDSVTGNASGSHTFSRAKAKENVFSDTETVLEALEYFDTDKDEIGEHFLSENWEWFDVIARCFVLGSAISDTLDDLWKDE